MDYLKATIDLYTDVANTPDDTRCCVSTPPWRMPDLDIPDEMFDMNYGCGTTVHPRDIPDDGAVLYLGVGGGLELLQFASLARRSGGGIGVDPVPEMLEACERNFEIARARNPWFVFNIFKEQELDKALAEAHRALREGGALSMSDPISDRPIPDALRADDRLRAACISGSMTLDDYLARIVKAGFGTIEIRGRRPYRFLDQRRYPDLTENILLESVEVVAYKSPVAADGPCVFTGRTAIWYGDAPVFDDGKGHQLRRDVPMPVCDKTAAALDALGLDTLLLTPSTWHYNGGGCC